MAIGRLICASLLALGVAGCATRLAAPVNPPATPVAVPAQVPAPPPPPDPTVSFVEHARAMLGQPYRYGGSVPGGFDCSGLIAYAARASGLIVPRTAEEQLHTGQPVSRGELTRGDLVFMRLAHKELHVGIALDRAYFIHAPSSGGRVRIDSLEAVPYARSFFAARRIVLVTSAASRSAVPAALLPAALLPAALGPAALAPAALAPAALAPAAVAPASATSAATPPR